MRLRSRIQADTFRLYGSKKTSKTLKGFFTQRHFRAIITLRLCQASKNWSFPIKLIFFPFFRILHKLSVNAAAIDLPWETNIKPGFAITHGWGLVIAPGATIGHNVTLFHGVTIGRRDKIDENGNTLIGYPTLEDNVWVGPNAIIVGDITIGKGSRIAAGAFVTNNIPPHSIVIGNPSSIVKQGCSSDVTNPINIISSEKPSQN